MMWWSFWFRSYSSVGHLDASHGVVGQFDEERGVDGHLDVGHSDVGHFDQGLDLFGHAVAGWSATVW